MIDNTIIPSYFNTETRGAARAMESMNNLALRVGEVKAIFYPDNPKNISGKLVEYTVDVLQQDGQATMSSTLYHGCVISRLFGGGADSVNYTLRPAEKDGSVKKTGKSGVGSKVLLLCINGNKTNAVIVGGLPDPDNSAEDKKADGHNYFFEFNGVQQTINKDGEFQIRYRGATKVDGKLTDEANPDAEGSTVIFNKEGSIKLYTKDEKQLIHLNNKDKKLEVLADEEWKVTVNKKLTFDVGDSIQVTGKKNCSIEVSDNITMKSSGVHVGGATDAWLLADTYRRAESQMFITLSTNMVILQGLIAAAGASLQAAGKANIPPIVGGAASAAPFAAAATALTAAAPIFTVMSAAIQAFEAQAVTFLSKKNRND